MPSLPPPGTTDALAALYRSYATGYRQDAMALRVMLDLGLPVPSRNGDKWTTERIETWEREAAFWLGAAERLTLLHHAKADADRKLFTCTTVAEG
jgi:hypothetical protein